MGWHSTGRGWRSVVPVPLLSVVALGFVLDPLAALQVVEAETLRTRTTDGIELVGELHLPDGVGPFPAVVFTHGSEPGTRSHRGYLAWAAAFRAAGIAALVFDKRGAGESEGEYVEAPDLSVPAEDLMAWVRRLRTRADVAPDRVGVLGWSQGGWVGPLAASRMSDIAFVVSISGPGVSPLAQNIFDKTNQFRASGASPEHVELYERAIRLVWTYLVTGQNEEGAQDAWDAATSAGVLEDYAGWPMLDRERFLDDPRLQGFIAHSIYDPKEALGSMRAPLLALFGGADQIVPIEASIEAMQSAFAESGNPGLTVRVFPGADHVVRVSDAAGGRSYAPGLFDYVVGWVQSQLDVDDPG